MHRLQFNPLLLVAIRSKPRNADRVILKTSVSITLCAVTICPTRAGVEGRTPHSAWHAMGRHIIEKTGNIAAVRPAPTRPQECRLFHAICPDYGAEIGRCVGGYLKRPGHLLTYQYYKIKWPCDRRRARNLKLDGLPDCTDRRSGRDNNPRG